MSNSKDSKRHSLFDRLAIQVGNSLGTIVREVNRPTVPVSEYEAVSQKVDELESLAEELKEQLSAQRDEHRELVQILLSALLEQGEKIDKANALLEKSSLEQDKEQLSKWCQLGKRVRGIMAALLVATGWALHEAVVGDYLYPPFESGWRNFLQWFERNQEQFQSPNEDPPKQESLDAVEQPTPKEVPAPRQQPKPRSTSIPKGSFEPEMVFVPAGTFLMGSDKSTDSMARDNEFPQHEVYLDSFYISKYPITNLQYYQFIEQTDYVSPGDWRNGQIPDDLEMHPVASMSWYDAQEYCQWLSNGGKMYKLPTEAQWEKAARGTDRRIYPWGNESPNERLCNFRDSRTTLVGKYPDGTSPYGCFDMAGNVWEWTSSLYQEYPYKADDGREDPEAEGGRVLRGGAFIDDEDGVRCAARFNYLPGIRVNYIGFRVVAPGSVF